MDAFLLLLIIAGIYIIPVIIIGWLISFAIRGVTRTIKDEWDRK